RHPSWCRSAERRRRIRHRERIDEAGLLPNGGRAAVEIAKLSDYYLNSYHEDGKHKARVFRSALGLGRKDAEWLRGKLLQAAPRGPASRIAESRFGTADNLLREGRDEVVKPV